MNTSTWNRNDQVVGLFRNSDDAQRAIQELRGAGFNADQIGYALGDREGIAHEEHHRGFWQKIEDFFSGNEGYEYRDTGAGDGTVDEGPVVGRTLEVPESYDDRFSSGETLVTVNAAGNRARAEEIITRCGGTIESNFEPVYGSSADYTAVRPDRDVTTGPTFAEEGRLMDRGPEGRRRIQLLSEVLRVNKQRVQSGEVHLRKEVITEQQTIQVPVTREELVVERHPVAGETPANAALGADRDIRIPLSEERVTVEKQPVVREEVEVGKRAVQENRNVSDQVRREELRVEDTTGRNADKVRNITEAERDSVRSEEDRDLNPRNRKTA
jgi:uncharacterized protein (TIGR02271 family)